jgi:hypothetical protein
MPALKDHLRDNKNLRFIRKPMILGDINNLGLIRPKKMSEKSMIKFLSHMHCRKPGMLDNDEWFRIPIWDQPCTSQLELSEKRVSASVSEHHWEIGG